MLLIDVANWLILQFTGHSLGAAVAALDAVMLRMQLPQNVEVDSVVFGQPRTGNQQFADMMDSLVRISRLLSLSHD